MSQNRTGSSRDPRKNKKKRERLKFLKRQKKVFICFLIVVGIIGLIIPLRPKESELEKRTLTEFPTFTWAGFVDGSFTDQLSTWYADTFPFREALISLDTKMERLYGLNAEELHGDVMVADEIPVAGELESTLDTTSADEEVSAEPEEEEEELEDGTVEEEAEKIGTIYVADGKGFGLYGFDAQGATNYAAMVNNVADSLEGVSNVYCLLAPTNIAVELSEERQAEVNCSSERDAFDYIYDLLQDNVTPVSVLDELIKHNSEYVYYRTDHHWTADGAWYAYKMFMEAKGEEPCDRDEYEKVEFEGLIGSFYTYSNQSSIFSENPDTVVAYIPETNDLTYQDHNYATQEGKVITDVSNYAAEGKYMCFIMGDEPFEEIHNDNIDDGSAIVVIKESYGNCFVPFLVNNYEDVYVVDYRYYTGGLTSFVKENDVDDVLFLNNANAISTKNVANINAIW